MNPIKVFLGALSFIGAFVLALSTWAFAVTWWYSADIVNSIRRK